ncbi:MAG: four-carbon acid sugar kinase family protein [Niabella sp.]|nr:four-carbon acid sugar kinase family protein [Niabella sp.]
MILVIADDFTGAAEMAGICMGYGLRALICTDKWVPADTDVLILSTNSRSMDKAEALKFVGEITRAAAAMRPAFVYKKIDSVLRGHVADELLAQMEILGLHKAVIVPANPSLGRTISGGKYFIDGTEIAATAFAKDPEFPVPSSEAKDMLGIPGANLLKRGDPIPEGLNIAETETAEDAGYWASQLDPDCFPAGSGDLFDALLQQRYKKIDLQNTPRPLTPHLYVSGTSFATSRERIRQYGRAFTVFISAELMAKAGLSGEWLKEAGAVLHRHQKLIIAFDDSITGSNFDAVVLRNKMAEYVKAVVDGFQIRELFVEGGATAATIFRLLGIQSFEPVYEWTRGVVQMKTGALSCIVKPGSYGLPETVKDLYGMW